MFNRLILAVAAIAIFMVVPSIAGPATGCNKVKFYGSYTRASNNPDIFGDGSNVNHSAVFQLNIHSDGTVTQYWTGLPDYLINLGTGSGWVGSWTCRADGKLVVTVIGASYAPDYIPNANPNITSQDVTLINHARSTYLFSVDDENTLSRIQARSRTYAPADDPTDPAGGTLGTLSTTPLVYKRLIASDADLIAP